MKKFCSGQRLAALLTGVCMLVLACAQILYAAADYADAANWAYLGYGRSKTADVFLIAPTVYLGRGGQTNLALIDSKTKADFLGALNMERGIYADSGRLFAPYYSQAALRVYTADNTVQKQALATAYADIEAAFDYYMANYNDGRPVILAGFSQGGDMCIRLLKDRFRSPEDLSRLVAAYAIGWRLTQQEVQDYPQLRPAQAADDTGVVVTFNSEAPAVQTSLLVPTQTLAINPLNWRTDSTPAPAAANLGACFTDYSGRIVREVPNFCGAYLDPQRGTVKVTGIDPSDYPPVLHIFAPGVYHLYDYQFFYRNLQQNVQTRLNAFASAPSAN